MIVNSIRTRLVKPSALTLFELLDESITEFHERSVLAITSKVVSLCEGRIVPTEGTDKEKLIQDEADLYMPVEFGKYGFHFTITRNTLISMAGIDQSNGDDQFVLWPANPQKTVNDVREYLCNRFGLKEVGVIVTDSTCMPPMRVGTVGVLLAHSGFVAIDDHVGKPDLFGRPFKFSRSGVGSGLAATANLVMGEADERTPLVIISEIPHVEFQVRNPTQEEIDGIYMNPEEDLYAPFINQVKWIPGGGKATAAADVEPDAS
jgi:F420-0:gamma-glutamyl ligase